MALEKVTEDKEIKESVRRGDYYGNVQIRTEPQMLDPIYKILPVNDGPRTVYSHGYPTLFIFWYGIHRTSFLEVQIAPGTDRVVPSYNSSLFVTSKSINYSLKPYGTSYHLQPSTQSSILYDHWYITLTFTSLHLSYLSLNPTF